MGCFARTRSIRASFKAHEALRMGFLFAIIQLLLFEELFPAYSEILGLFRWYG